MSLLALRSLCDVSNVLVGFPKRLIVILNQLTQQLLKTFYKLNSANPFNQENPGSDNLSSTPLRLTMFL